MSPLRVLRDSIRWHMVGPPKPIRWRTQLSVTAEIVWALTAWAIASALGHLRRLWQGLVVAMTWRAR